MFFSFFQTRKARKRRSSIRIRRLPSRRLQKGGGEISVKFQGVEAKGNLRRRNNTLVQPTISWTTVPGKLYAILMWDPDAPAPSWIHLLSINLTSANFTTGQTLLSYTPPTPPSGEHRYYVTVYEQPQLLQIQPPKERGNFDVAAFVQTHSLSKVGEKMIRVSA